MNHKNKVFTREEVKEILVVEDDVWGTLIDYTQLGLHSHVGYSWLVEIEMYRVLLRFGYGKEKLSEFVKNSYSGFFEVADEINKWDKFDSGHIKIDMMMIRARVDKKIAAWEQSKKPVEQKMNPYEQACKEWMKGCSCSREMSPADCYSCTAAFLEHVQKIIEKE